MWIEELISKTLRTKCSQTKNTSKSVKRRQRAVPRRATAGTRARSTCHRTHVISSYSWWRCRTTYLRPLCNGDTPRSPLRSGLRTVVTGRSVEKTSQCKTPRRQWTLREVRAYCSFWQNWLVTTAVHVKHARAPWKPFKKLSMLYAHVRVVFIAWANPFVRSYQPAFRIGTSTVTSAKSTIDVAAI